MKLSSITEATPSTGKSSSPARGKGPARYNGPSSLGNLANALISKIQSSLEDTEGLAKQEPYKTLLQQVKGMQGGIFDDSNDAIDWWIDLLTKLDFHPQTHKQIRARLSQKLSDVVTEGFRDILAKSLDMLDPNKRQALTGKVKKTRENMRVAILIFKELQNSNYTKYKTANVEKFLKNKADKDKATENKPEQAEPGQGEQAESGSG